MTKSFIRAVEGLSRFFGVAAAVLLVFAMLVVCQMIFVRYILRAATIWQTEAVVFGATAAVFLGAPYVLLTKGHVGVDFVQMVVSPRTQRRLTVIGAWLGLLFCLIMTVACSLYLGEAIDGGWTTPSLAAVPLWMPLTPVTVGFGLLSLQYIAEIVKATGEQS